MAHMGSNAYPPSQLAERRGRRRKRFKRKRKSSSHMMPGMPMKTMKGMMQ